MTIIKNGTIVTADLTYRADIRIDGDHALGGHVLDMVSVMA